MFRWFALCSLVLACEPIAAAEAPTLLAALEKETAALAARALPGVVRVDVPEAGLAVHVEAHGVADGVPNLRAFRVPAAATGFVWDAEGHIVTAVLPDKDVVQVTLHDGRAVEAKVLGTDPETRLAVLQAPREGLVPLPLGDSTGVRPGAWVLALVARPEGPPATHLGIVAATDQAGGLGGPAFTLNGLPPLGGAGGPLLDTQGEVIAILTEPHQGRWPAPMAARALPIHIVRPIVEQLKAGQRVRRGFLGLTVAPLSQELAKLVGLEPHTGVFVQDVTAGGPAAAAGVQAEDVILAVGETPVRTPEALQAAAAALAPGTEARLVVWRKGQKMAVTVIVGERPDPPRVAHAEALPRLEIQPVPGGGLKLPVPMPPGVIQIAPGVGAAGRRPEELIVTIDFQANGLVEAVALALNGTGCAFTLSPELLKNPALLKKPFGTKATNTPLSQVLDQLAAHYGIRWSWQGGPILFDPK